MVALYMGVFSFVGLLFEYINHTFKDSALQYYSYDPYGGAISYFMASLIVLAPVTLILMRVIRNGIAADHSRAEVWVRRWALFLTLFIAGFTIVVDLIVLLTTFLNGEELTARFLLKVLVVLLVAAAGFMHFWADLRGYWEKNPHYARTITWGVAALVVVTILAGFVIVGTPQTQRQYRVDDQRVQDLQSLQSQIIYFYQQKERLPQTLAELNDPLSYYSVPVDPETDGSYGYRATGPLSFELCATFNLQNRESMGDRASMGHYPGMSENWQHGEGEICYARTIDPELYPPVPKGR